MIKLYNGQQQFKKIQKPQNKNPTKKKSKKSLQKMSTKNNNKQKHKNHRKYHRVSTFTPDQQTFINYLMQRGYDLTLKAFQEEIEEDQKDCYDWFEKMEEKGGEIRGEEFRGWVQRMRGKFLGEAKEFVKLEFLLIILLCSQNKNRISSQNLSTLKIFIEKNGVKLSEFPQLLPYFALPYIQSPSSHPFLSKIYTKQWKSQIKQLLQQNCKVIHNRIPSNKTCIKQQNQWYSIVKDLIQISLSLGDEVLVKDGRYRDMIQRVKKYQRVIQEIDRSGFGEGQSIKPSELSRLVFVPDAHQILDREQVKSIQSISSVHEIKIQPIAFNNLKQNLLKLNPQKPRQHRELCLIFNSLHQRIFRTDNPTLQKNIITSYIQNDIFFLKNMPSQHTNIQSKLQQIQCIKLINTMCSYSKCIKYLSESHKFINILCKIVIKQKNYYLFNRNKKKSPQSQSIGTEQRLLQVFGLLQKILFNKEVVDEVMKTELVSVLVLEYAVNFQVMPSNALTYVLALLLNIILKPEGKIYCSALKCPNSKLSTKQKQHPHSFFELIVKIWKHVCDGGQTGLDYEQTQLQSLIYSTFYVLLSLDSNKKIAKNINFKSMLQKYLSEHNDDYHIKVMDSIYEVLNRKQGEESWQQSQIKFGEEFENEEFQEIQIDRQGKDYIWVGDRVVQLTPEQQKNSEAILSKYYISNQKQKQKSPPPRQKSPTKQKKQNISKPTHNENLYTNLSAPLASHKLNSNANNQQLKQKKHENKEVLIVNHSQNFDKVSGYDPSKYEAWRKLKSGGKN